MYTQHLNLMTWWFDDLNHKWPVATWVIFKWAILSLFLSLVTLFLVLPNNFVVSGLKVQDNTLFYFKCNPIFYFVYLYSYEE